jgi:alkanesulfonate monooxygenase SsuD/methylene tetrahydromethanopterin reductase-like flavin-dependent oxidoreductase (luciferase family)
MGGAEMKLSMFSVQDHYPDRPRSLTGFYDELKEQIALADRLGFYAYFVAEHHFHEYGVFPNPAVALANAAGLTTNIRLGPAVSLLTFRNPLTVAEDWAMVDQLSGGRLELGVGSGYLAHEFAGFNIDPRHKREMFDEGLEIVKRAMTGERFSFKGGHYEVNDVALNVTPIQQPVPIYVAVLRREAAYYVGKQGNRLMTVPYASVDKFDEIEPLVDEYAKGFAESGAAEAERDVVVALHTYVAETDEAVRRDAADAFDRYVASRLYAKSQVYDDIMASGLGLLGSVDTVVDKLVRLHDMGVNHVAMMVNFGGLEHDRVCRATELIANEVRPRVEKRIAQRRAA